MKIRFVRMFKLKRPEMSGRRLAAAKRAIQRKNDQVALFPEMQDRTTPEERVTKSLDGIDRSMRDLRAKVCLEWRAVRAMLRQADANSRRRFLGYWNTSGHPGSSEACLRMLRSFQAGNLDIDTIVNDLRNARRIGFESFGYKNPSWVWFPYGDPETDEPDPRTVRLAEAA